MAARQIAGEGIQDDYWSRTLHTINDDALTNTGALRHARGIETDISNGMSLLNALQTRKVPNDLVEHVQAILSAINEGWFVNPRGPRLTYSKTQHASMHRVASRAPWLIEIQSEASEFESYRLKFMPERGYSFGVRPLPNLAIEATNISNRLSRLPLEHVAGEITVALWLQIMKDTQARARQINDQIECLSQEWMWDRTHQLCDQVDRLRQFDCMHLLHEYVSTTRNRHLDRFEAKLLDDVRYRHLPVDLYESRLTAERQRQADEARAGWALNYSLIGQLAAILDGVTSYHRGTLARRLTQESKGQFRLQRSTMNSNGLVIELRHQYEIGHGTCSTPFRLVNYCLALADEVRTAEPSFEAFLYACDRAYDRIKDLEEPTGEIAPLRRLQRPDDFDDAAA